MEKLYFKDDRHEDFYSSVTCGWSDSPAEQRGKLITYLLGASPVTRKHYEDIYDRTSHSVRSGCWRESWNTSESRLLIAWASALVGSIEAPAAGSGTLMPCLLAAYQWSDVLEELAG